MWREKESKKCCLICIGVVWIGYNQRDTKHKHHTSKSHLIYINLVQVCIQSNRRRWISVYGSVIIIINLIFIDETLASLLLPVSHTIVCLTVSSLFLFRSSFIFDHVGFQETENCFANNMPPPNEIESLTLKWACQSHNEIHSRPLGTLRTFQNETKIDFMCMRW